MTEPTRGTGPTGPVLAVENLVKTFSGDRGEKIHAVRGVSFALDAGESLAIVGESGSGKSTTANIIMGLEHQTSGTVKIFGRERSARPSRSERRSFGRDVQIVFQDPYSSLDPRMPIAAALDAVLKLHFGTDQRERSHRIDELLDRVGLPSRIRAALPRDMSGGQRQRVAIARALAAEPRILVLDEAVAALDVSVQAQVLNLLADIRESTGVAYVFITHDLAVVRQIADRSIVMYRGEVVEEGMTEQILDHPAHPYTRRLRASIPTPEWRSRARYALTEEELAETNN